MEQSADPHATRPSGVPAAAASPLRPGDQLAGTESAARVVVVRAPAGARPAITCGGGPMVPATGVPRPTGPQTASGETGFGTLIGKRYVNADETLELLCVSSGAGALGCDGVPMTVKAAKPLPASD